MICFSGPYTLCSVFDIRMIHNAHLKQIYKYTALCKRHLKVVLPLRNTVPPCDIMNEQSLSKQIVPTDMIIRFVDFRLVLGDVLISISIVYCSRNHSCARSLVNTKIYKQAHNLGILGSRPLPFSAKERKCPFWSTQCI